MSVGDSFANNGLGTQDLKLRTCIMSWIRFADLNIQILGTLFVEYIHYDLHSVHSLSSYHILI